MDRRHALQALFAAPLPLLAAPRAPTLPPPAAARTLPQLSFSTPTLDESMQRMCDRYLEHVRAYLLKEKIRNPFKGTMDEPNEGFMRSVEGQIDIPEVGVDDFRREVFVFIGFMHLDGVKFTWHSNPELKEAFIRKFDADLRCWPPHGKYPIINSLRNDFYPTYWVKSPISLVSPVS